MHLTPSHNMAMNFLKAYRRLTHSSLRQSLFFFFLLLFFFFNYFLIGGKLLYSFMLVSSIQQYESVISISPPSLPSPSPTL